MIISKLNLLIFQFVGEGNMKQECTVADLVKIVEDLTRIH